MPLTANNRCASTGIEESSRHSAEKAESSKLLENIYFGRITHIIVDKIVCTLCLYAYKAIAIK